MSSHGEVEQLSGFGESDVDVFGFNNLHTSEPDSVQEQPGSPDTSAAVVEVPLPGQATANEQPGSPNKSAAVKDGAVKVLQASASCASTTDSDAASSEHISQPASACADGQQHEPQGDGADTRHISTQLKTFVQSLQKAANKEEQQPNDNSTRAGGSRRDTVKALQLQWILLALGVLGLLFFYGGFISEAGWICPAANDTLSRDVPPAFYPTPFEPQRTRRWIETTSHLYASCLAIAAIGTALFMSVVLTAWVRWSQLVRKEEETKKAPSSRKASVLREKQPAPVRYMYRNAVFEESVKAGSAADDTRHQQHPNDANTVNGKQEEAERDHRHPFLRALRWVLIGLFWLHKNDSNKRASLAQWLLFVVILTAVFSAAGTFAALSDDSRVHGAVGFVAVLVIAYVFLLQYVQDSIIYRLRRSHPDAVQESVLKVLWVSSTVLILQAFVFCFFVSYAYATLPCLPLRSELNDNDLRADTEFVANALFVRFAGSVSSALHMLFLLMWWVIDFILGGLTLRQLLHLRASRSALARTGCVGVAVLAVSCSFSTLFSEQSSLFLIEEANDWAVSVLATPSAAGVILVWCMVFVIWMGSAIRKRLQRKQDVDSWNVYLTFNDQDDDGLKQYIVTEVKFRSRDFLRRSHPLSVGWRAKEELDEIDPKTEAAQNSHHSLAHTDLYVPILSAWVEEKHEPTDTQREPVSSGNEQKDTPRGSLSKLGKTPESYDPMLLELILGFELRRRGRIKKICPIFSGGKNGNAYGHIDVDKICERLPNEPHKATNNRAIKCLEELEKQEPTLPAPEQQPTYWNPRILVKLMACYDSFLIHEYGNARFAEQHAVNHILLAFENLDNKATENVGSS